jgi:hypothetical protein
MLPRVKQELDLLVPLIERRYGTAEVSANLDWLVVRDWELPAGWNKGKTDVLVLIPPGYPSTPPDNVHTDPDLRLANGDEPGNAAGNATYAGRTWRVFSYHVETADWHPSREPLSGHNLLTFLEGTARRFQEAS